MTSTTTTAYPADVAETTSVPISAAEASRYQQLRGHLAALKLATAAEHCPPCSTPPAPRG